MPLADLLIDQKLNAFSPKEITAILSCFADVKIPDYYTLFSVKNTGLSNKMKQIIENIEHNFIQCENVLNNANLEVKNQGSLQYNLCDLVIEWYDLSNEKDCLMLLKRASDYELPLGIWCKSVMKICNMVRELEKVCTYQ